MHLQYSSDPLGPPAAPWSLMEGSPEKQKPSPRHRPKPRGPSTLTLGQSRSTEDLSEGLPGANFRKGFSLRNVSLCVVDGVRDMLQRSRGASPEPRCKLNGDTGGCWSPRLLRMPRGSRCAALRPLPAEVQREGALRYMVADDSHSMGSNAQWQKCRLLLRRMREGGVTEGEGGFLLEFYVPPKVSLVVTSCILHGFGRENHIPEVLKGSQRYRITLGSCIADLIL